MMNEDLRKVQKVVKIANIICKIGFVACMIGVVGCGVATLITLLTKDLILNNLKAIQVEGLSDINFELIQIYSALIVGIIACGLGAYLCKKNQKFCQYELSVGEPFNYEVAERLKKLAIFDIVMPFVSSLVCGIIWGIANAKVNGTSVSVDIDVVGSIGFGLTLYIISLILRYGASKTKEENFEELSK